MKGGEVSDLHRQLIDNKCDRKREEDHGHGSVGNEDGLDVEGDVAVDDGGGQAAPEDVEDQLLVELAVDVGAAEGVRAEVGEFLLQGFDLIINLDLPVGYLPLLRFTPIPHRIESNAIYFHGARTLDHYSEHLCLSVFYVEFF